MGCAAVCSRLRAVASLTPAAMLNEVLVRSFLFVSEGLLSQENKQTNPTWCMQTNCSGLQLRDLPNITPVTNFSLISGLC